MASFFSSVQRETSTFCALMHIYQLSPYVLSTSFSTHPKPLTWDKKPFQSRRVHFFSTLWDFPPFFGTVRLIFFRIFFIVRPINLWYFATEWMFKKSQSVPPFTFFGTMRLTGNFKKIRKFFFSIFSFLRAFVVSSCRKSGFRFRVFLSLRYGAGLFVLTN